MQKQKIFCWAIVLFFQSLCCFASEIQYIDTIQNLGTYVSKVAFGDLDNDGDLDIFVNHFDYLPNKVWLNDGSGNFSDSVQNLGSSYSVGIDLADLDGDGDLDAFVGNFFMMNNQNKVWLNDGNGNFSDSGQSLGSSWTAGVGLGDLDGDGDADAFVADGASDTIWLNDGSGNFSDSGQRLGSSTSFDIELGDLDGDGDLDAFVTNGPGNPNKIWFNDGNGNFSDSGQSLGIQSSPDAALGDLDDDGDLDVFVATFSNAPNTVWLNDGSGNFSDSGQSLGSSDSEGVNLGDLDNDGDLDAVVSNISSQANEIWFNDGSGNFSTSSHDLGIGSGMGFATIGDLDSNGVFDLALPAEGGSTIFLASFVEDECLTDEDCDAGYACVNGTCAVDGDLDGVGDTEDNCPDSANADQADQDNDIIGDVCDTEPYFSYPSTTEDIDDAESIVFMENDLVFVNTRQVIIWSTRVPFAGFGGLGWASRIGVAHSYASYREVDNPIWSTEEETVYLRGLGFYGRWSWVYPAREITTNGTYEIKLISEDSDGERVEVVYTIEVAVP